MKHKIYSKMYLFTAATGALALVACASPARAPLASDSSPSDALSRLDNEMNAATSKQYDRLSPTNFSTAMDYRDSAKHKLDKGKDSSKILEDIAVAEHAVQEAELVGAANESKIRPVLNARQFALEARANQFQDKAFQKADSDLADMGKDMEKGKFKVEAKEISALEQSYIQSEIAARQHVQLGEAKNIVKQAKDDGAKKKTPGTYERALAQLNSAEQAIAVSPRSPAGYSAAVSSANQSAKKLSEVLSIARKNKASEELALTLWNQNQALTASRAALSNATTEAANTKDRLQSQLADKNDMLSNQKDSIVNLQAQNNRYANEEELKMKIEEMKKNFSSDEAEIMKDGNKLVVRLKKLNFPTNRADLNSDSFETLKKVEDLIASVPAEQVMVEGHTDSIGSNKINKPLSQKRAETVKSYLMSQGLSQDLKIDSMGYGSDKPLTTNKTKVGRATNRRVDIVIETPVVL